MRFFDENGYLLLKNWIPQPLLRKLQDTAERWIDRGLDPARLKAEFGDKHTFWGGGADTSRILNRGTPEEVRADVLRRCEIFAPGGGFVWNTIHNITPDVPPRNNVAMFDAVKEFSGA